MAQQHEVLAAIDRVIGECLAFQEKTPDPTVAKALANLREIEKAVRSSWPLSAAYKVGISLGPYAAKNISDWNPELAEPLMVLHHALKHDGDGLQRILTRPV